MLGLLTIIRGARVLRRWNRRWVGGGVVCRRRCRRRRQFLLAAGAKEANVLDLQGRVNALAGEMEPLVALVALDPFQVFFYGKYSEGIRYHCDTFETNKQAYHPSPCERDTFRP